MKVRNNNQDTPVVHWDNVQIVGGEERGEDQVSGGSDIPTPGTLTLPSVNILKMIKQVFARDTQPEEWVIVARNERGHWASLPDDIDECEKAYWGDPPTKKSWLEENADNLITTHTYYCASGRIGEGINLDNAAWQIKPDEIKEV